MRIEIRRCLRQVCAHSATEARGPRCTRIGRARIVCFQGVSVRLKRARWKNYWQFRSSRDRVSRNDVTAMPGSLNSFLAIDTTEENRPREFLIYQRTAPPAPARNAGTWLSAIQTTTGSDETNGSHDSRELLPFLEFYSIFISFYFII